MSTRAWCLEHFTSGSTAPRDYSRAPTNFLRRPRRHRVVKLRWCLDTFFRVEEQQFKEVKSVGAAQFNFLRAEKISPASSSFENFQSKQSALATLFLKLPFDFTFTANTSISKHASTTCSAWPHPSDAPPVMLLACAKTSTSDTVFVTAPTPLAVRMSPAV